MKFIHISVQPLFSVVFLSNVTLSGLTEEMNKKDHVNTNVTELSLGLGLVLSLSQDIQYIREYC